MSWHFSQALVEAFWAANCSDGEQSALSRLTDTPATSCCHGKTTDASARFPSGMTFAHSMGNPGEALLTWFQAGSRVRIFPLLGPVPGSRAQNPDYGMKCTESFARYDQNTHSWKTPQPSLFTAWEPFSVIWPRQGIMLHGACWERMIWAPHMSGNAGGVSRMMPTPTCQDAKNLNSPSQLRRKTPPLCAVVGGKLNPAWVEWLMGWPIGWTDCTVSGTDRFRAWQLGHSSFCLKALTIHTANGGNAKTLPQVTEKR